MPCGRWWPLARCWVWPWAHNVDRINHVQVRGEVSAQGHLESLARAAEALVARRMASQVVQYADARLLLTPAQMVSNVLAAASTLGPLTVPTALVVHPDQMEHWRTYASLMGQAGVLRGVFSGPQALWRAQAWAAEMAALRPAVAARPLSVQAEWRFAALRKHDHASHH